MLDKIKKAKECLKQAKEVMINEPDKCRCLIDNAMYTLTVLSKTNPLKNIAKDFKKKYCDVHSLLEAHSWLTYRIN